MSNESLNKHVKSVHEKHEFKCDQCDKSYSDKRNLSRHVKSVHEGTQFVCDKCEKSFSLKDNLKRHVKSVHEQEETCQLQSSDEFTKNSLINDENTNAEHRMEVDDEDNKNSDANQIDVVDNDTENKTEAAINGPEAKKQAEIEEQLLFRSDCVSRHIGFIFSFLINLKTKNSLTFKSHV